MTNDNIPLPDVHNQMDGLALLDNFQDSTVAVAFLDPQYRGVLDKLAYGNEGARQIQRSQLPQMNTETIQAFLAELARVLRPSGHLFLWVDKFHLVTGVHPWIDGLPLEIVDMITWDKKRIGMGYRSRRQAEHLVVLQKLPKRAKGCWNDHSIPDVWSEKASKGHAHTKPIDLQTRLIWATTKPGDIVVDPAAGSYSVLEACSAVGGLTFYGSDIEEAA